MSFLVSQLIKDGYLKSPQIIEAFLKIDRSNFVPKELKEFAQEDRPLPIGFGQTISQPCVVAFMLELLQPQPGEKILDIGSGSGWTSTLLAEIVSKENKKGKVIAIEIIPELVKLGKENAKKYNFVKKGVIKFILGDGKRGYEKETPFDKILVSASASKIKNKGIENVPPNLKKQLKIGGKIVIPIGESIWLFIKKDEENFEEKETPGFIFVPLISSPLKFK